MIFLYVKPYILQCQQKSCLTEPSFLLYAVSIFYPFKPVNNIYYSDVSSVSVRHSLGLDAVLGNEGCISLFWKIIKDEETNTQTNKIIYQINLGSRSSATNPKPVSTLINAKSWGKKYPKNGNTYDGITWVTVESSIEKFTQFVSNGFAYRLGIKENGNDIKNYIGSQGIAFDLDHNPSITLKATLQKIQELGINGIIHYSPSGNPENNKMRLIVFFDEFVKDYDTVNHLTKCIGSLLPNNSNHVHDPARFFYGSILPIPHTDILLNNFISLNERYKDLIEKTPRQKQSVDIDTLSLDDEGLTIPQKFGIKFSEWLKVNDISLGEIIQKWIENHDLELHNWNLHDSPGSNLEQWRGLDPINGEESKTGSSFTVYHASNGSYGYNSGRSGASGDLIDLWYRLKHHTWNVNGSVKSRIDKSGYWQCLREICEFLNVSDWSEEFAPKSEPKQQEIIKEIPKSSSQKNNIISSPAVNTVDVAKTSLGKTEGNFTLTWQDCYVITKNGEVKSLDPTKVALYFLQQNPDKVLFDTANKEFWVKINHIWKPKNHEAFQGVVLTFIHRQENLYNHPIKFLVTDTFKSKLCGWFKHLEEDYLIENPESDWNYIPCANGLFQIETKKFFDYSNPEIQSVFVNYHLPYKRKASTGEGIKLLKQLLERFFIDKRCIDDFLLWVAGVVQNRGYRTKQAVSLIGAAGSGKSSLCNLVRDLVAPEIKENYAYDITKNLPPYKLFSDDGVFNQLPLEHQRLVILSEFTGFTKNSTKGSDAMKNLIADTSANGYKITSPIKHANRDRSFMFKGAFITNSQDYTKFKCEDEGISRRLMIIRVQEIKEFIPELFNALDTFEIKEDLWNYFLDFDLEDVYIRMSELASAKCTVEWKIDATIAMNQANNPYWQYALDRIEIVTPESLKENEPVPTIQAKSVYEDYTKWCFASGEKFPGTQTSFGLGLTKAIAHFTKTTPENIKKRTNKGVVYSYIRLKQE